MNRRDDIINIARQLFSKQGYHATSIRQIAAGVGCRESAIYVHFKNGKRELLQTILKHHMPDFDDLLSGCGREVVSGNALEHWGQSLVSLAETHLQEWQWIAGEFPTLRTSERAIVREKLVELHQALAGCLQDRVHTETEAQSVAWAVVIVLSGYAQWHRIVDPNGAITLTRNHFMSLLEVLLTQSTRLIQQANVQ